MPKLKKFITLFLIGTVVFLIINHLAVIYFYDNHAFRNEMMAFYLGPMVSIGNIIDFFTNGTFSNNSYSYNFLAGPQAIQVGGYAPWTIELKALVIAIGIGWSTFLTYLYIKFQLPKRYNSPLLKIPFFICAVFAFLAVLYFLNGNEHDFFVRIGAP